MTKTNATKTFATTTAFAWIVVALVAASAGGCMNASSMPRPRVAGDLAVAIPVALPGATVQVTVTGSDLAEPVTRTIDVEDGVARGTVSGIAAGRNRLVLVTATDAQGRRCSRELNASVDPLAVSTLGDVALECTAPAAQAIAAAERSAQSFPPVL
jgi:hypothetical protein